MRFDFVILAMLMLVGCNRPPERQPRMSDAQLRQLRAKLPGITDQCLERMKWEGTQAMGSSVDQCFKMLPPMRWRGLWRDEFEGQMFCPEPATQCPAPSLTKGIAFNIKTRPAGVEKDPLGALYAVDFIGRRTAQGTPMEAVGFQQEIVVDRMISIKQVEGPPTKAEMKAWWRACRASRACPADLADANLK